MWRQLLTSFIEPSCDAFGFSGIVDSAKLCASAPPLRMAKAREPSEH